MSVELGRRVCFAYITIASSYSYPALENKWHLWIELCFRQQEHGTQTYSARERKEKRKGKEKKSMNANEVVFIVVQLHNWTRGISILGWNELTTKCTVRWASNWFSFGGMEGKKTILSCQMLMLLFLGWWFCFSHLKQTPSIGNGYVCCECVI